MHARTIIAIAFLLGLIIYSAQAQPAQNSCRTCHLEAGDALAAPVHAQDQNDIHASRGVSCHSCHGGDPTTDEADLAMSKAQGFIGKPRPQDIPQFCGRCHADPQYIRQFSVSLPTDQLEKYWTSWHGAALKAGDPQVATCVSCHGVHTILPANNPLSKIWPTQVPETCRHCHEKPDLMARYNLPATAYRDYAQGVHGKALLEKKDISAPACNDCHGNHGAVPPGVESIAQVCRECHLANAELFLASPHKEAFDALDLPECVSCHENHLILPPTEDWLGIEGEKSCGRCHSEGESGYQAAVTMKNWLDSLRVLDVQASQLVAEAEERGIDVSEAQFALEEAREAFLKSRTIIHSADLEKVITTVNQGLLPAHKALELGEAGLAAFEFRKRGLGIATIFITLLIIALWLKLRQIEKSKK